MSNSIPSSLALTVIADGSPRIAAPVRNNFSDIQTAVNGLDAALSGGTAGQVLTAVDASTVEWAAGKTVYAKTTAKDVANTTTETDLLNGEITVAANKIAATGGMVRGYLWGDILNNSGAADGPTFRLKFGGTTFWAQAVKCATAASRVQWTLRFEIPNLGATNSQWGAGVLSGDWSQSSAPTTGRAFSLSNPHASIPWSVSAAQTVDTTVAQALAVTAQWGTASTTRSCNLDGALIEIV